MGSLAANGLATGARAMIAGLTLRQIARALGGDVVGPGQVGFPAPFHSRKDRSATLRISPKAPDGFVVFSHAGEDFREIRDHVRTLLGLGDGQPIAIAPRDLDKSAPDFGRLAADLWRQSLDPRGTLVETYLASRALELPPDTAGEALRFRPTCLWREGEAKLRVPAMVAAIRDIRSNALIGVHRTRLDHEGRKVDRRMLGPSAGGAVKLTPDEDVTCCLGVGEGIESTLSLRLVPEFGASPVWALLTAGNLAQLPALSGIECLWIAVDHDPAGFEASNALAATWRAAAREVFLVTPRRPSADLNDLARRSA
jgi:putative DNA primase/helicase